MKKLILLLLFIPLVFSCSNDEIELNDNPADIDDEPVPRGIKLRLQELWKPKLVWNSNNTIYAGYSCGYATTPKHNNTESYVTGFETGRGNHYSLDTIIVKMLPNSNAFNFFITPRFDKRPSPKRIGHIELIRMGGKKIDENSKIILSSQRLKYNGYNSGGYSFPIKYFTSNVDEDLLASITLDSSDDCKVLKMFEKVNTSDSFREYTETGITVDYDDKNLAIKIGDSLGYVFSKEKGGGWPTGYSNFYIVVSKEIIYYD